MAYEAPLPIRQEDVGKENIGFGFYFLFPHFPVWWDHNTCHLIQAY
jgi:hypothetical protein